MCGCGCSIISSLMKRLGRSACCSDLLACGHAPDRLQRLATGCPPPPKPGPVSRSRRPSRAVLLVDPPPPAFVQRSVRQESASESPAAIVKSEREGGSVAIALRRATDRFHSNDAQTGVLPVAMPTAPPHEVTQQERSPAEPPSLGQRWRSRRLAPHGLRRSVAPSEPVPAFTVRIPPLVYRYRDHLRFHWSRLGF
ncbi:hypothetical protein SKAU_G00390150 [Synaphobranchus kaupii]|uniref:Uncharacterized protein n=1 Tax=Synaphobranchus kaupii TaxID=118154 RepID=A0A9Q1EBC6_SYNKA|nr:hypothetical protein SKAU_G00390150 [Synaphobranchus kaupii]